MGFTIDGKGGRQKPVNAELNLVPYIDLLTCMVAFLLITAVWTQLARMNVTQKGQGAAGSESEVKEQTVQLTLFINQDGYDFAKSTGENTNIPKKGDDYDYTRLADVLKEAKAAYPDKNDIQIKSDDTVIYNKLIHTMDIALSARFSDVSLGDKGGGA